MDYAKQKLQELGLLKVEIENSGLKKINEEWYNILMAKLSDLNLKVIAYKEKPGTINKEELVERSAEVGALFEFYMQTEGNVKVASLHVREVQENLLKIINKLNKDNYEEVEKELKDALALYEGVLSVAVNSITINEMLAKVKYQIFKYKFEYFVIDDSINIESILSFVIEDINSILNDAYVSECIKDELKKYALDVSLIMNNFHYVMILISLGLNKKDATKMVIDEMKTKTFYKESDIKKEYHGLDATSAYELGTLLAIQDDIENKRKLLPSALINSIKARKMFIASIDSIFTTNILNAALTKTIGETLIANGYFHNLIDFRTYLSKNSKYEAYIYSLDCAVIAYKEDLNPGELVQYIIASNNDYLIRFICKSGKNDYFIKELAEFACKTNNDFLLTHFINNDIYFNWSYFDLLPSNMQIAYLERKLNDKTKSEVEKQGLLVASIERGQIETIEYAFSKILIYNDFDLIIKALNKLLLALPLKFENNDYFFRVINSIPSESLKQEVLDYYYEYSLMESWIQCSLIRKSLLEDRKNGYNTFQLSYFFDFNVFEMFFASSFIDASCLFDFVKAFYKNRLDWEHILKQAKLLSKEEFYQIRKYCYLGNRDYFINNVECSSEAEFIEMMVREVPESIVDFLVTMAEEKVSKLPSETLEVFCRSYEERMNIAKETVGDKLVQFMNSNKYSERVEFLTYIMQRGLLNTEIMTYIKYNLCYKWGNSVNYGIYHNIMFRAIKNAQSYLRPSLILQALDGRKPNMAFNWECLFMSSLELMAMDNNDSDSLETKDLKKRKYYGDLLKLLNLVPGDVKRKIIFEVSRSGIEEYLLYIKTNCPEYMDLVLANVTDIEMYKRLVDFDGTLSIDDALRVSMLDTGIGTPRT